MIEQWFLGYCQSCPDGNRPGRIVILASLRRNASGQYVVDRHVGDLYDEVGPSGSAFWPQEPAPLQDLTGSLIRFRTYPSQFHGDSSTMMDWLRIYLNQGDWEVHRIGHRIIEQGPDLQWRQEPRWVKGVPEGEQIFVRQRSTSTLVGLWRVGQEVPKMPGARALIPHSRPNMVFEFAVKDLDADCIYSGRPANELLLEALLYAPDQVQGHSIDLATPKQLAKWLVDRMIAAAPQAVTQFDRDAPGWRTRIKNEIEEYGDPERHIFRSRWQQIETLLNDLVFEVEATNKLLQLPAFHARVDELVTDEVAARVCERASEIESAALEKAKSSIEAYDQETERTRKEYEEAISNLEAVEKDVQARLNAADAHEQKIHALQSHLDSSRDRLLMDLSIYQSLLPSIAVHLPIDTSPTRASDSMKRAAPTSESLGPSITDTTTFIDSRFWPSLACWYPGVPRILSVIFHATICGSKAVIIPSPAWARAYADALGAFSRLSVVNVEPTWLGFGDLWNGGLSRCWERACRDPSTIELVLLRDFNHALPQCYARPIFDLIAGYTDTLPEPGCGSWPKTLRLLACPAPSAEALPLTAEVVRHFAAIQRDPMGTETGAPSPLTEGHVTSETWMSWIPVAAPSKPDSTLAKEFGPLTTAAADDVVTIAQVLLSHGMGAREATRTARDMRVTEPEEYLIQSDAGVGGAR